MIARIYSLYWDNIDTSIVAAQQSVCNHLGLKAEQHRIHGLDHGEWIDWVMSRNDGVDVFLFLDADCIPLTSDRLIHGFNQAASGTLYGAEGAANHIDPARSYAGAWYVFVNREMWNLLGRPSAKASPHNDICQLWTDVWYARSQNVELISPTACLEPRWDLPGRPKAYGTATTYGADCFHLFESRHSGKQRYFLDRCRAVCTKDELQPLTA